MSQEEIYTVPNVQARIVDTPISFVKNGISSSETIYFQRALGVHYSRVEANLDGGVLICEAGNFMNAVGHIKFERLNFGIGNMVQGFLSKGKGDEFFKPKVSGYGRVYLRDTTGYLIAVPLNNSRITLEKGVFYAAIGNLKIQVDTQDFRASNLLWQRDKRLINIAIQGTGYVFLELPVRPEDLIELGVNQNIPVLVDDDLVLYRTGRVKRTSSFSGGFVSSLFNKTGIIDRYEGQGKVIVAPTLRAGDYIGLNIHNPDPYEEDNIDRPHG